MNFDALRRKMVQEQLVARGIADERVLAAFLKAPRHKFLPQQEQNEAYSDFPLPIGCGQTISQPYMVALMTQCLGLKGAEKILEIGTGSGYQTAILSELAKEVYTIERFAELSTNAEKLLKEIGCKNIYMKTGDGTLGWQENAPFDGIIITAGAPCLPHTLFEQLAEDGRIVIPIGKGITQALTVCQKKAGRALNTYVCDCMFVPLVGEEGHKIDRDNKEFNS